MFVGSSAHGQIALTLLDMQVHQCLAKGFGRCRDVGWTDKQVLKRRQRDGFFREHHWNDENNFAPLRACMLIIILVQNLLWQVWKPPTCGQAHLGGSADGIITVGEGRRFAVFARSCTIHCSRRTAQCCGEGPRYCVVDVNPDSSATAALLIPPGLKTWKRCQRFRWNEWLLSSCFSYIILNTWNFYIYIHTIYKIGLEKEWVCWGFFSPFPFLSSLLSLY